MAAQLTLFNSIDRTKQVPVDPQASYTATFTAPQHGIIRVYANGADVNLTIMGFTFTIPSGSVEYFGVRLGQIVTVA